MKTVLSILISLVIIVFAAGFFVWNYFPNWAANTLTDRLGVSVSIGHVNFTPNSIGIYYLSVGNPPGSVQSKALKVQKIKTEAPLTRFLEKSIVVDKMTLSNLYLDLEFQTATDTRGNWTEIMNNLSKSLGSPSKESKELLIKKLVVENLTIDLVFKQGDGRVRRLKPIPRMEFNNVSSSGDFPMGQLTNLILSEMLKEVFREENLKNMLEQVLQTPGRGANSFYNSIKQLFSFMVQL